MSLESPPVIQLKSGANWAFSLQKVGGVYKNNLSCIHMKWTGGLCASRLSKTSA
jgi:hypothetical protein